MMKWTNTKEALPEEDKFVLVKEIEKGRTRYFACRRIGKYYTMHGCSWYCASPARESFWVYLSDIETNMENAMKIKNKFYCYTCGKEIELSDEDAVKHEDDLFFCTDRCLFAALDSGDKGGLQ